MLLMSAKKGQSNLRMPLMLLGTALVSALAAMGHVRVRGQGLRGLAGRCCKCL